MIDFIRYQGPLTLSLFLTKEDFQRICMLIVERYRDDIAAVPYAACSDECDHRFRTPSETSSLNDLFSGSASNEEV